MDFCDRIKHPVLPPAVLHFLVRLVTLTAKPPATFIRSFQITKSLICKRRLCLTHKSLSLNLSQTNNYYYVMISQPKTNNTHLINHTLFNALYTPSSVALIKVTQESHFTHRSHVTIGHLSFS